MRTVTGPTDHVIVVGAGLAGLSAAMRLAAAGRRVTVLEREAVPGGRAGLIRTATATGEYRFDTGPTVLTMPDLIQDCFDTLGESMTDRLEITALDPLYRAGFADGSQLDVHSDTDRMQQQIAEKVSAADAAGFRRYVEAVSRLYRHQIRHFIDRSIDGPLDMLAPAVLPDLFRLVRAGGFGRLAPMAAKYFKDERLQRLYSFQALYAGVSPQQALALYAVISYMDAVAGVFAVRGGMHALPRAMADAAADHGVSFRYNTTVTAVERRGRRAHAVHTADGERLPADVVVLNPDLPVAYRDLLGTPPGRTGRRLNRLRHSPSCYLMLAGTTADYPHLAHHNIHFGHSWAEVFDDLRAGRLMRDPSILVSNPTRSDPSLAPPGRQIYYVLFPAPNLQPRTGPALDWHRIGPRYREHVLATLTDRGYPGLADSLEVEHVTTPADWLARGMAAGTPFAAAHTFGQTGPFRPGNIWGENVVFAGSGTQPGVGVPMVLISGRLAAERITGPVPGYRSRAWPSRGRPGSR